MGKYISGAAICDRPTFNSNFNVHQTVHTQRDTQRDTQTRARKRRHGTAIRRSVQAGGRKRQVRLVNPRDAEFETS